MVNPETITKEADVEKPHEQLDIQEQDNTLEPTTLARSLINQDAPLHK